MDEEKGYNGWTNYETWNVALWIDNDEWPYRYWRGVASEAIHDNETTDEAALDLAGRMKDAFEDEMPELNGTYADLLSAALSEVNWHEIAKSIVDEISEERKEGE